MLLMLITVIRTAPSKQMPNYGEILLENPDIHPDCQLEKTSTNLNVLRVKNLVIHTNKIT